MASPQKENGYVPIANELLERLVKTGLLGSEYQVLFFFIRKTYGFNKKEDKVSLTQFEKGTGVSRPTVVKALKNLVAQNILVKSALLVYKLNKDYDTWLVNTALLVKHNDIGSKDRLTSIGKDGLTKTSKDGLTHKRQYTIKDTKQKTGENTPSKNAKLFFKGVKDLIDKNTSEESDLVRGFLQETSGYYPSTTKEMIWTEVKKFYMYWTELNQSGTKERWQKQETFQVDRRLLTWFGKVDRFKRSEINKDTKVGKL